MVKGKKYENRYLLILEIRKKKKKKKTWLDFEYAFSLLQNKITHGDTDFTLKTKHLF